MTFDSDHVYVSLRCRDSHPERMVANEMRRDNNNMFQNEYVGILFDTFYDRRNALVFATTPIGGRADGQITNEKRVQRRLESDLGCRGRHGSTAAGRRRSRSRSSRSATGRGAPRSGASTSSGSNRVEERDLVSHAPSGWRWAIARFLQVSAAATLVGLEVAAGIEEPGHQAVRHVEPDERSSPPRRRFRTISAATSGST